VSLHNKKSDTKGHQYVLTKLDFLKIGFFIDVEINVIYTHCNRFIRRKVERSKNYKESHFRETLFFLTGFTIYMLSCILLFISLTKNFGKHFVVRAQ